MTMLRLILKKILPPILVEVYKKIWNLNKKALQKHKENSLYWEGNYTSWEEAKNLSDGYDSPHILAKVLESTLKVKNGEAAYERDSFVFDKLQYSWSLLACLFRIAAENHNELTIIDFGGALGSHYFQNIGFLKSLNKLQWTVVEQEHFVKCGKQNVEYENLTFAYTIDEAITKNKAKVLLLSGVIQYLDKPYEWIEKFLSYDFEYIIIDRTAFIEDIKDRLTIQHIPEYIYKASYPSWFFNKENFLSKFAPKYEVIAEFNDVTTSPCILEDNKKVYWLGVMLKIK